MRAQALLLSQDELLSGRWAPDDDTDPDSEAVQQSTAPQCLRQASTLQTPELVDRAANGWRWAGAEGADTIYNLAYVYSSAESATAAFNSYQQLVNSCTNWQVGTAFNETQEVFPIEFQDQSFGRILTTNSVSSPDISGGRQYWGVVRAGSAIVEVAYYPGPLLDTTNGRNRTVELVKQSASKAAL